jgi:hypothetical protein
MELRELPLRRLAVLAVLLIQVSAIAWAQGVNLFPSPGSDSSGQHELAAFASAYPDRVGQAVQRDGDWAVQIDGEWFFWAHGRILPQAERSAWEGYARFRFYPYPPGLPPLPQLDAETEARLKKALAEAREHPPRRSEDFLERLYDAASLKETESHIITVNFLGFSVKVHQRIAQPIASVAAECEALRRVDPQVAAFLAGISEVDGFNYRYVADTATRSYHSYGLAVDLIPRSWDGKTPYWLWAINDRWWATPYERRWMVPLSIVAAFEKQGFVWGGKWLFFDTMHFEYRPEIFILAGEHAAS